MSKIIEQFQEACLSYAERTAFFYLKHREIESVSFERLGRDVGGMEALLREKGVIAGTRILIFVPTSYELVVFMFACLKIGAPVMVVDVRAGGNLLDETLSEYGADYIAVSRKTRFLKLAFGALNRIRKLLLLDRLFEQLTVKGDEKSAVFEEKAEDDGEEMLALLTMTTGSTGKPKIALRNRRDLYHQLELINDNMDEEGENVILTTAFMYGFANVLKGFTTVLPQVNLGSLPFFLNRRLKKFSSLPITSIITSPDFCLKTENFYPGLKRLYLGGAILNRSEAKTIVGKYPEAKITYIYGATECNLIAKTDLNEYLAHLERGGPALLGQAVKGVEIRIDEASEINVSAKAILKEYLSHDRSNGRIDEDGTFWHKTGDAGELRDGKLYYLGRKDVYVEHEGRMIHSNPLEQELVLDLEGVEKCAFFHHAGKNRLFLQGGSFAEEEVRNCLRKRGMPADAEIYLRSKIPCDAKHHTKIDYRKLRRSVDERR